MIPCNAPRSLSDGLLDTKRVPTDFLSPSHFAQSISNYELHELAFVFAEADIDLACGPTSLKSATVARLELRTQLTVAKVLE